MHTTFFIGVKRKLLDLRTANGGVQIVVKASTFGEAEKCFGQMFKLARAQGLGAAAVFVTSVEQPVQILFDKPRAGAHGARVAKQEQDSGPGLDVAAGNVIQQAIEQLDRRCFITVDAGRQQQIHTVIATLRRAHFKCALGQPAHPHAVDSQLSLLGRFTSGQGQFKQFAEGEHKTSFYQWLQSGPCT